MSQANGDIEPSPPQKAAQPADKAERRKTIRDIDPEAWVKLTKASELSHLSHGAWASAAFHEKFDRDRAATGLPAVIVPAPDSTAVTTLVPTVIDPKVHIEATAVDMHLRILEAVARFTADNQSDTVRIAADKVVVDRLKLLRITKARQTKPGKSLPQVAEAD